MQAIYILIMLWGTSNSTGGLAVVTQEFTSLKTCEYARKELAKAHDEAPYVRLKAQGCFKK